MLDHKKTEMENKKETGRWAKEEHQRFMLGIMQHGKDWKKVQEVVKTRTGSQVRSHAQKFFNKLQKEEKHKGGGKRKKSQDVHEKEEMSESQKDYGLSYGDEASNTTPIELVSLIKNESKEGKKINLENLKEKLEMKIIEEQAQENEPEDIGFLQRRNSFKSMNNILSAYQTVKEQKKPNQLEDQSFLIKLTKKYKNFFTKGGEFSNLIDFGMPYQKKEEQISIRKRSFTLPEGVEGDEDDLLQRKKRVIEFSNSAKMSDIEKQNYRLAVEKMLSQKGEEKGEREKDEERNEVEEKKE